MADIFGTPDPDVLDGTLGDDVITGEDGDDTIDGRGGDDYIIGGSGADVITGGAGNDTFAMSVDVEFAQGDSISGGSGYDRLVITDQWSAFVLGSLIYSGIEELQSNGVYGVQVTLAQLGAFQAVSGAFRLGGVGALALNGPTLGNSRIALDAGITAFSYAAVAGITVEVQAHDGGVTITGSASNDILAGGSGNDTLNGGAGNDAIYGGFGIDLLTGGTGDDTFSYGTNNDAPGSDAATGDAVDGGDGTDTLYFNATDPDFSLSAMTFTGIERIINAGFNVISVSLANLLPLTELSGSFRLMGSGPITTGAINLGSSALYLDGSIGTFDYSAATYSEVNVFGSAANETITGGIDRTSIYGGDGNDTISGIGEFLSLSGEGGNDTLNGNAYSNWLSGGAGLDSIYGFDGDDALIIRLASDVVAGEIYDGGAGNDTLDLSDFFEDDTAERVISGVTLISIETLYSPQWATLLTSSQLLSATTLQGKFRMADNTAINLAGIAHSGLQITLNDAGQSLSLAGSSNYYYDLGPTIYGGLGNDTITGGEATANLHGGGGDDVLIEGSTLYVQTLYGDAGNDRLILNNGATAIGGTGYDTVVLNGAVWTYGISEVETIEFTASSSLRLDGFDYRQMDQSLQTATGNGTITVDLAVDVVNGFAVSTAFNGGGVSYSGSVRFVINGTQLSDIVKINPATAATVNADGGNDQIRGGQLSDTINGGAGNDKIIGSSGADILTGGTGSDQFRYLFAGDSGLGAAADRITDYATGSDKINFLLIDADAATSGDQAFSFIGTGAFAATGIGQIRYTNSGADLLVQADVNGDGVADMEIILQGLNGGTLTAGDFIL